MSWNVKGDATFCETGSFRLPRSSIERARLLEYAARFNARDFDAVRDMLADDVRLDLVNRLQQQGRNEVAEYFHRYAQTVDWRVTAGAVDGRPALLVFDPPPTKAPRHISSPWIGAMTAWPAPGTSASRAMPWKAQSWSP